MHIFNMHDAKTNLSRLVELVESGAEQEILIARNGKPAARLVPISRVLAGPRIGMAKGKFLTPPPSPEQEGEIAALFNGPDA